MRSSPVLVFSKVIFITFSFVFISFTGCLDTSDEIKDTDGDGYLDNVDVFPLDSTEWFDVDEDGVGDNSDVFPTDSNETHDSDNDGAGDNSDAFPLDSNETHDSDNDGVGDNSDTFPTDSDEWIDSDGDGVGDNSDAFPLDSNETHDSDGDGIGNNQERHTLRVMTIGEFNILDPASSYESSSASILVNTYETLIFYDREKTDKLVPVLAEEVPSFTNGGISPDGLTYTFKIRQDVTFHDGSIMDADDVVFSINRLLIMDNGPAWMYNEILDRTDADGDGIVDSITKVDQYTVRFELMEEASRFLPIMTYTAASIISKDWVSEQGCETPIRWQKCTEICDKVMGTGPYMLTNWIEGELVQLDYYPEYWKGWDPSTRESLGLPGGHIKKILKINEQDSNARVDALRDGLTDFAYIEPSDFEDVITYDNITYEINLPSMSMIQISFNHDIANHEGSAPSSDFFANEDIRKAFSYSFDYDAFLNDVIDNKGQQPRGPIPDGLLGYNANGSQYSYNPDMAEFHFKEAGVWDDGFTVKAYFNLGNDIRLNALLLLEERLEEINPKFDLAVQGLEWPLFLGKLNTGEVPLFMLGWAADYADPHSFVHPFLHGAEGHYPSNYLGFQYDDLDNLITEAAAEQDAFQKQQMYYEIAELEHEKALHIWVYQPTSYIIMKDWVNGWYHNPMHASLYYTLSL